MAAFWNKQSDKDAGADSAKKGGKGSKPGAKQSKKAKPANINKEKAALFSRVLLRPVISEHAMNQQMLGKYVFEVNAQATKHQIAEAITAAYGVTVEHVNTLKYKSTLTQFRAKTGKTRQRKKAIVSVAQGQQIQVFQEA